MFPGGLYDVFLSFNFLEHQPDPVTMLRAIWNNLEDDAMGLITVPSFEYIMEHSSYYELIRDHIAYYTFDTLTSLMERSGFDVVEASMINRDTLSLIVRKRPQVETENLLECYVNLREEMNTYMKYLRAYGEPAIRALHWQQLPVWEKMQNISSIRRRLNMENMHLLPTFPSYRRSILKPIL